MAEIHHKKRKPKLGEAEDVIVKVGKLRIYFQNYYTLLSLGNDILLGTLYFIGSLAKLLNWPEWIRLWSYLAGAFFVDASTY